MVSLQGIDASYSCQYISRNFCLIVHKNLKHKSYLSLEAAYVARRFQTVAHSLRPPPCVYIWVYLGWGGGIR